MPTGGAGWGRLSWGLCPGSLWELGGHGPGRGPSVLLPLQNPHSAAACHPSYLPSNGLNSLRWLPGFPQGKWLGRAPYTPIPMTTVLCHTQSHLWACLLENKWLGWGRLSKKSSSGGTLLGSPVIREYLSSESTGGGHIKEAQAPSEGSRGRWPSCSAGSTWRARQATRSRGACPVPKQVGPSPSQWPLEARERDSEDKGPLRLPIRPCLGSQVQCESHPDLQGVNRARSTSPVGRAGTSSSRHQGDPCQPHPPPQREGSTRAQAGRLPCMMAPPPPTPFPSPWVSQPPPFPNHCCFPTFFCLIWQSSGNQACSSQLTRRRGEGRRKEGGDPPKSWGVACLPTSGCPRPSTQ